MTGPTGPAGPRGAVGFRGDAGPARLPLVLGVPRIAGTSGACWYREAVGPEGPVGLWTLWTTGRGMSRARRGTEPPGGLGPHRICH